ncbi:hypothetical protein ATY75_28120 [Rhizobium sp. N122]|nr:hypothetical protein ATY75_28120 [Rhizobium sp. N122]
MDARNPPRYERGIIITEMLITLLSMPLSSIKDGFEQASVEPLRFSTRPFDHQNGYLVLRFFSTIGRHGRISLVRPS